MAFLGERKPVPFFHRGPDESRCYARDYRRWSIVSGEDEDAFLAKVILKKGWGIGETISSIALPLFVFVLFGSACLAVRIFDPGNEGVGEFLTAIICVSLMLFVFFSSLIWMEVSYFARLSEETLTVYRGREFSCGEDGVRVMLPVGSLLQYTLHHPEPGAQGASGLSELDLVVRDGDEVKAIHKLMAHQNNWCWRHAQELSKVADLPLKRGSLQSNGKPFPPALLN